MALLSNQEDNTGPCEVVRKRNSGWCTWCALGWIQKRGTPSPYWRSIPVIIMLTVLGGSILLQERGEILKLLLGLLVGH